MKSRFLKNNLSQYQRFNIFPKHILSPTPEPPFIFSALLSWDRMITGIRESGRPMAAFDRGVMRGRSFP
jgi:hypothetical protein